MAEGAIPDVVCGHCGHVNPAGAPVCAVCGTTLAAPGDHTITIPKIDPHQDGHGRGDDTVVTLADLAPGAGVLVVRSSPQEGERFVLGRLTRLGRHPESEISLDDITVSRRHAEIMEDAGRYLVRDVGSLNGTYVNQERVDEVELRPGDDLQVGKFHLVFFAVPQPS